MRGKKRETGAYLTIEAALVMPIVLAVIVFVVYMLFFQYDRCLMEQNAGVMAMRGCTLQIPDKEERLLKMQEMPLQKDEKYLAWEMLKPTITLKGNKILLEQSGQLKFPFAGLLSWQGKDVWESSIRFENNRIRPVEFIRNCRKVLGGK